MSEQAEILLRQAQTHRAAGRAAEAAEAYAALLAMKPDLPDTWFNLALMQRKAGRPAAALASYQQALDRGIGGPEEVYLNRGVIYADDLGQAEAAEAELTAALALQPGYLAALLNLGNLHEDKGERDAARAAYERALAVAPDNVLALARLANATRFQKAGDPLLDRIRAALARPQASDADCAELGFALGRALDEVAAYDDAFAAYAAANAASKAAVGIRYDRTAQEAFVDRSIATFARPVAKGKAPSGAPVFILGAFRSGSTLVERILAAHSGVTSGGELGLLPRVAGGIAPYPEAVGTADAATVDGWRSAYLEALKAARPDADLVTDKRPENFLHIGLIKTLFPDAKILHTVRDPIDTALSNWFLHLDRSMAYAVDLEDTAHWLGQHDRLMAHWKTLYPHDIHTVDYDALVADPRPAVADVLGFCGLDWEDGCLEFHTAGGAVRTASVWQVREPLYQRSSGRWRNYERHLEGLRAGLDRPSPLAGEGGPRSGSDEGSR